MNPFYDLNKKLNSIDNEQEQIAKEVAKAAEKSPVRKTLEESLKSDLKSLMEDGTGGANFSGSGSLEEKKEKWIQKATKPSTKGDLHKALNVPQDKKIPKAKIEKATHSKDAHLRHMAQFAKNVANEDGLPDIADKKEKMRIAKGGKDHPLKNVAKGLKAFVQGKPEPMDETDHSEEDILDYLNRKLAPHDKAQQAKEDAVSRPFNGPADAADAYNGMYGTGMKDMDMGESLEETVSRKHFQQVADLLKNIPDEAKRKEMALHHASIFKQQNPRFDIRRFAAAAGVDLEECAMWEELKGGQHKLDVDGDGEIEASDLAALRAGKKADSEVDEGYAEMDAWLKQREKEKGTGKFDKRKVSTGTVYTRKPETFDEPEGEEDDKPAVKRGRGRPATGRAEPRKTKGAYKHKPDLEEKAVSKKQQKFMGMVHAAQKGEKAASPEVAKVAKGMTKKAAHDFAATKHKGLPEKVKAKKKDESKEDKVEETTTAGSVATSTATHPGAKAMGIGKGIYDSFNREVEAMIAESVKVEAKVVEHAADGDEEAITVTATGSDVHRLKELLQAMGIEHSHADHSHEEGPCPTCGGVPCQCDEIANANGATLCDDCGCDPCGCDTTEKGLPGEIELSLGEDDMEEGNEFSGELAKARAQHKDEFEVDGKKYQVKEADAPVDDNEPDYPSNEEESDDALQYSGGLNGPKSTGQTTIPVIANQGRQTSMESKDSVDSFLNLYQAFKTK